MITKRMRKWGLWLSALLVVALVGCQAVAGLNLDEMLLKQMEVKSTEQSGKFEIDLDWNEEALAAEDPEIVKAMELFKKITFTIDRAAMNEAGRMELKGSVNLGGKGEIPLAFHTDDKALRLDLGGLPQPIVVSLGDDSDFGFMNSYFGASPGMPNIEPGNPELTEWSRGLVRTVGTYFVHHLPNPPKISVDRGSVQVHGESITLNKVHAELDGEQLGELVPVYVDNLIKDEAGLKAMINGVLQSFQAMPAGLQESFGGDELLPTDEDNEAAVKETFNALLSLLKELQTEIANAKADESWGDIFDKGISLKTDLYVDDSLHIRKNDTELVIAPAYFQTPDSPVRSIRIHSAMEFWNVNGDVKIADVEVPDNALTEQQLEDMQPYQFVRALDSKSVLYDVLKNEAKIDDQSFEISNDWGIPFMEDEEGTPYVPLRVAVEELGARITFTKKTKEIRFTDYATNKEIVLYIGSDESYVNGQPVKLKHSVAQDGPYAYVAADDLFGLLGATYNVEEKDDGELVMTVERDL